MNIINNRQMNNQIEKLIDLLMIALGVFGIIGGLVYAFYFPIETICAPIILIIIGIILYHIHFQKKRSFVFVAFIMEMCVIMLGAIFYFFEFNVMLDSLLSVIQNDYFLRFDKLVIPYNTSPLFFISFVVMVGIPIVTVVVSIVTKGRLLFVKFFIVLLLLFFPVLVRHEIRTYTGYCVILFLLYEYVSSYSLRLQKNSLKTKSIILSTMVIALIFSSLFLENNPLFNGNASSILSQVSNWFDETGNTQTGISSTVDGSLPTGNIKLNSDVALTITSPVDMNSYIRGYSMAHYDRNSWHPVNEKYTSENSLQFFSNYIYKDVPDESIFDVKIESSRKTSYQFVPYFTLYDGKFYDDSYYTQKSELVKVVYDDNESFDDREAKSNRQSYYEYTRYVENEYMDVPETLRATLTDFLINNYKEDYEYLSSTSHSIESKVKIIEKILSTETKYDLNAGDLPDGKDFVEYFLTESKKGSCTHYATTAALMLRCFGIPARYTSGFIMKKSDFHNGTAVIKNSRAHAWIEVYYKEAGWFPYEVTPSQNGTGSTIESVVDALDQNVNNQQNQMNQNIQQPNTTNQTQKTPSQITEEKPWYDFFVEYSPYFITGLIFILMVILYRFITRKLFLIRLHKKNSNEKIILYYQRLLKLSRFGKDIDSSIHDLTLKAQFSQYILDDELESVIQYYGKFNHAVYQTLSWYKKIIYKYVFGYI